MHFAPNNFRFTRSVIKRPIFAKVYMNSGIQSKYEGIVLHVLISVCQLMKPVARTSGTPHAI